MDDIGQVSSIDVPRRTRHEDFTISTSCRTGPQSIQRRSFIARDWTRTRSSYGDAEDTHAGLHRGHWVSVATPYVANVFHDFTRCESSSRQMLERRKSSWYTRDARFIIDGFIAE